MSYGSPPPRGPEEGRPAWDTPPAAPRPYPRTGDASDGAAPPGPGGTRAYPAVPPQGTGFQQAPSGSYAPFPQPVPPQGTGYAPVYGTAPSAPDNFLAWAVFATVFCCFLAGIPALVAATSVNERWAAGDQAGAFAASLRARNWTIGAVLLGVVFWTAWMVGVFVLGLRDTLGNL